MKKKALKDQHGLFQHFQSGVAEYNTRDSYLAQRGGRSSDPQKLYGLGPEHPESYQPKSVKPGTLSTRYVPGRPGVQALRVSTGVFQDPQTKEVFDYNEGFTTSDGRVFGGGTVDLQTDLVTLANRLDKLGLTKEASFLDSILLKIAQENQGPCEELAMTILNGTPWAAPHRESGKEELMGLAKLLMNICKEEGCIRINNFLKEQVSDAMSKDMAGEDLADEPGHNLELSKGILGVAMETAPDQDLIS